MVRTEEEDHAAKSQALRQISERVPHKMERNYDWTGEPARVLFDAVNTCVLEGMLVADIEDMLDMPGLHRAYLAWLGTTT